METRLNVKSFPVVALKKVSEDFSRLLTIINWSCHNGIEVGAMSTIKVGALGQLVALRPSKDSGMPKGVP